MEKSTGRQNGIETLLSRHKQSFRIPENLNHYSEADFREAEKKYLKLCITEGRCNLSARASNNHGLITAVHIS